MSGKFNENQPEKPHAIHRKIKNTKTDKIRYITQWSMISCMKNKRKRANPETTSSQTNKLHGKRGLISGSTLKCDFSCGQSKSAHSPSTRSLPLSSSRRAARHTTNRASLKFNNWSSDGEVVFFLKKTFFVSFND